MRRAKRITANALLAASLLAALVSGAGGCSSDGYRDDYYDDYYGDGSAYDDDYDSGGYYDDGGYYVERRTYYRDPYHYRGGHGGYYHRRDHRDYHRQSRSHPRVPRDAQVVANGQDGLAYTAPQSGRVYVRDEKTGKVIYGGRVDAGDEVKVAADAKGRRVSVDGRTARGDLSARPREREVYFRPDRNTVPRPTQATQAQRAAANREARAERTAAARAERAERTAARSASGSGSKKDDGKK